MKEQALVGVTGAHGAQGSAIQRALAERGIRTRGFGRRADASAGGQEYRRADLSDRAGLLDAFSGLSALCFTLPLVYDLEQARRYAENVAAAAVEAGVERIVFNANVRVPGHATDIAGFETRRAAEEILLGSGVPVAIVRPAVYLENLLAPPIVNAVNEIGVLPYPVPSETSVSWISLHDLGRTVAAVLESDDLANATVDVGGSDLTGAELAQHLGDGLDREVSFLSLDPVDFEAGLARELGSEAARGVAGIYHWLSANPDTTLMSGGKSTMTQLGITTLAVADWANTAWPEPETI